MHIIIDGYNLIRQSPALRRFERISLEEGRRELVRRVSRYKKAKGHKVTVVFDGWLTGPPAREESREAGIRIIFTARGETADEAICRMVEKGGEEIVVVTSDRPVARRAFSRGNAAVSSQDFEALMKREEDNVFIREKGVDEGEDEDSASAKHRGPSRRTSKKEKRAVQRLKKL